jgi:hypothetical protein
MIVTIPQTYAVEVCKTLTLYRIIDGTNQYDRQD